MRLILASTSPRRREILGLLGLPFEVIAPQFEETIVSCRGIEEEVLQFAMGKAKSVATANRESIVIGSDTMISHEGRKFGKPADLADAKRMLRTLSGKIHHIFTSVAVVDGCEGPGLERVDRVAVKMRPLSDAAIDRYLERGESYDKAGAYSIQGQGRRLIESIEGDYLAAVGMPLMPIARYLGEQGYARPLDVEKLYEEKQFLNWRSGAAELREWEC
jgi:septum formation protein